jgi:hypothetical protein
VVVLYCILSENFLVEDMLGLGKEDIFEQKTPRMIPGYDNVKFIAVRAASKFAIALTGFENQSLTFDLFSLSEENTNELCCTDKGKIYTWGYSNYALQSKGDEQPHFIHSPTLVDVECFRKQRIVDIACNNCGIIVLTGK